MYGAINKDTGNLLVLSFDSAYFAGQQTWLHHSVIFERGFVKVDFKAVWCSSYLVDIIQMTKKEFHLPNNSYVHVFGLLSSFSFSSDCRLAMQFFSAVCY